MSKLEELIEELNELHVKKSSIDYHVNRVTEDIELEIEAEKNKHNFGAES